MSRLDGHSSSALVRTMRIEWFLHFVEGIQELREGHRAIETSDCVIHAVHILPTEPRTLDQVCAASLIVDQSAQDVDTDDEESEAECRHSCKPTTPTPPTTTTSEAHSAHTSQSEPHATSASFPDLANLTLESQASEQVPSDDAVICYIGHLPVPLGKFDAARAKRLGITPGPDFKRLQQGESITLPSGTVVRPEDVIGAPPPAPAFVIVDCPASKYVRSLVENARIQELAMNPVRTTHVVVHMSPAHVFESEAYQTWMTLFGPQTNHIVINESYCKPQTAFSSAAHNQVSAT
jgi:hypothetical protein